MLGANRYRSQVAPWPIMPGPFYREGQGLKIVRAEIAALAEGEPAQILVEAGVVGRDADAKRIVVRLVGTEIGPEQPANFAIRGDIHASQRRQFGVRVGAE